MHYTLYKDKMKIGIMENGQTEKFTENCKLNQITLVLKLISIKLKSVVIKQEITIQAHIGN